MIKFSDTRLRSFAGGPRVSGLGLALAFACSLVLAAACKDQPRARLKTAAPASTSAPAGGASPVAIGLPPGGTLPGPNAPAASRFAIPTSFATQAASPQALAAFNGELQALWDRLRPAVELRLRQEFQARFQGLQVSTGSMPATVKQLRSVQFSILTAPGLRSLATNGLQLGAPVRGSWSVELTADVEAKVLLVTITAPVTVRAFNLEAVVDLAIDDSDPARPQLRRVAAPAIRYDLDISSSNPVVQSMAPQFAPMAKTQAQQAVAKALAAITPALGSLSGLPGAVPGAGNPPLVDSGAATPFEQVALGIEAKLLRDHLPHGILLPATMSQAASDSWLAAYGPGGAGNPGQVVSRGGLDDGALRTGRYLAAQAFRYEATRDPAALDAARRAIAGLGALIDINGGTGLLARSAAPVLSSEGQAILAADAWGRATFPIAPGAGQGAPWVGYQGKEGVDAAQYAGAFFGLGAAWERIPDPAIRSAAALRIRQLLDYLVARRWTIDEDRPAFQLQAGSALNSVSGAVLPVVFADWDYQRLAFLLIGERSNPGRYAAELARLGPLADTAWLAAWAETFTVLAYDRLEFGQLAHYHYFAYETDPARWRSMSRAFRIHRRFLAPDPNPHHALIHAAVDPTLAGTLHPSTREALRRFLARGHRAAAPAGLVAPPRLPSAPLDIGLRRYAGDFLWSRSPWEPAQPGTGDPKLELPGVDYTLPYWMGRYYGAF